jgi:hypothetical protein
MNRRERITVCVHSCDRRSGAASQPGCFAAAQDVLVRLVTGAAPSLGMVFDTPPRAPVPIHGRRSRH